LSVFAALQLVFCDSAAPADNSLLVAYFLTIRFN
jgi:hypothetical protein